MNASSNSSECNKSIGCSVTNCAYHFGNQDFCSLTEIHVGTHEQDPTKKECTDCQSFILK